MAKTYTQKFGPKMFVQQVQWCDEEKANLDVVHRELLSLHQNRSYFKKDKRRATTHKNPGPMLLGYTTFAGSQNTAVLGLQCPYLYCAHKLLQQDHPLLLDNIRTIVKNVWDIGSSLLKPETRAMELNIDKSLCFPGTRMTSVAVQFNMATKAHVDKWNYSKGWQGVLVLGLHDGFTGGEVDFGKVVRVKTIHGTCFFGKNSLVLHKVWKVFSGSRMIIACWSSQSVVDFSKEVLSAGFTMEYCTSLREARVEVLKELVKKLGGRKTDTLRVEAREMHTTEWFLEDVKYLMKRCR